MRPPEHVYFSSFLLDVSGKRIDKVFFWKSHSHIRVQAKLLCPKASYMDPLVMTVSSKSSKNIAFYYQSSTFGGTPYFSYRATWVDIFWRCLNWDNNIIYYNIIIRRPLQSVERAGLSSNHSSHSSSSIHYSLITPRIHHPAIHSSSSGTSASSDYWLKGCDYRAVGCRWLP